MHQDFEANCGEGQDFEEPGLQFNFLDSPSKRDGEREKREGGRERERERGREGGREREGGSNLVQGAAHPGISRPATSSFSFLVPSANSSTAFSPSMTMETKTAFGNGPRVIFRRQIEIVAFHLEDLAGGVPLLQPMM